MTSDTYMPLLGGGEYHVYYLLKELKKQGHNVTFFTTYPGPHPEDEALNIVRMPYEGWRSIPRIRAKLSSLIGDAELIHSHYSYRLAWIAAQVARKKKLPFVITQHGLGLLPQTGASLLQKIVFNRWRKKSMQQANTIISTSEDLSIDIRKLGFGDKIVPITNGYDASMFLPLDPSEQGPPYRLLTVRRLVPKNGIQFMIPALAELRATLDVHLDIVGDGPLRGAIEAMATDHGVADAVTFHGAQSHAELLEHYKRAHVVCIPSTAESTSLSCIEAMAQRKVIVASRVGGLIELLGSQEERGYLVPITDDEHCSYDAPMKLSDDKTALLADAINTALTDPQAYKKAVDASDYARSNFSWETIAEKTVSVYQQLV